MEELDASQESAQVVDNSVSDDQQTHTDNQDDDDISLDDGNPTEDNAEIEDDDEIEVDAKKFLLPRSADRDRVAYKRSTQPREHQHWSRDSQPLCMHPFWVVSRVRAAQL
jgi:hypothetical protein